MKRSSRQHYVRQMPHIYGNMQKPRRDWGGAVRMVRNVFWLVVAGAFLYVVFLSGFFSIKQVDVEGATFVTDQQIRAAVPMGRNIWLVSQTDIKNSILAYPSVETVVVQRGLPDHVRIIVHERQPALVWITGNDAFVLDPSGVAFAQYARSGMPALSGVPRLYDAKAVPARMGQQVSSASFISFIATANQQFASLLPEATIDHIEISETTYDVTYYMTQGLKVQMNSLADAGAQVRNLTRLIHQKDASLTSTVDLRVDRWAYVK